MAYVLIVDDETDLTSLVEFNLRAVGLETAVAATGETTVTLARQRKPDLVVLDLMLPDISGKEICRQFRADPKLADVPIMMLTARGDEPDRVEGFLAGADDYVTKPFSVRELVLRVQSILKRGPRRFDRARFLSNGPFRLDTASHEVTIDGTPAELTALEFKLLEYLMLHVGTVRTRQQLLQDVWEMNGTVETRTVDAHVMRLREKLGSGRALLATVRGVGYRLDAAR